MPLRLGGLLRRFVEFRLTRLHFLSMHLLYLDDAGFVNNLRGQYFVLGEVSVFEAQSHWVAQQMDEPPERNAPNPT